MKILVAEDSETQRKLMLGLLKELPVELAEASTGTDALDLLLRADGPSVALIDWEMPGLSGVELCQRVREAKLTIRPHLILVTGRSDRADVIAALKAGADDYLVKPPHPAELMARVQVGVRNVQLQQELQQRIEELQTTLRRLDVVGALAAHPVGQPGVAAAAREGKLSPALESLDAVRGLPERLASVLGNVGEGDAAPGGAELWAHLSLAFPGQASWLDVTLSGSRLLAQHALRQISGQPATTDQALLDCVSDMLALVMRGFHQQLEAHGIDVLKPFGARGFVGALEVPSAPFLLDLKFGGWTLKILETPTELLRPSFSELTPGQVLVGSLVPSNLPTVEVLAKGTVLKTSYLARAAAFFRGEAGKTAVPVMACSAFARERRGN